MQESENGVTQNVDEILTEIGFGKFQLLNYLFICIAVIVTTMNSTTFVFTARDTSYRCYVPECEQYPTEFDQKWLLNALPYENDVPQKCSRYVASDPNPVRTLHEDDNACKTLFSNSTVEKCTHWVYGQGNSIVNDFNIPCEDWKRSLVGTINGAGQLTSLVFSGIISDKYGRRNVMVVMTAASGVLGLIQAFTQSYWAFVVFEFLNLMASAGAYASTYVFGVEILTSKTRVYGSAVMNFSCIIATLLLGLSAWVTATWRTLLIVSNVPAFLMLLALCAIPESVRWLNAKGRKSECSKILRKSAKMNGVVLGGNNSMDSAKIEMKTYSSIASEEILKEGIESETPVKEASLIDIFKAPQLLLRLLICAFCWFTNVFVYFGLSLNSVNISGSEKDVYLNFILATVVEIPGVFMYLLILRLVGRKYSLFSTLLLCGVACVIYATFPNLKGTEALVVYLLSKLFIAMSFAMVYIFTSELFPTPLRNSTMNFCSVIGRIGGALAPQVPLLHKVHPSLPMLTYGFFPIISAFTLLRLPETKDKKLPDTVREAEHLE